MNDKSLEAANKKDLDVIRNKIKSYPDFPKPGVLFRDIFPLFKEPNILDNLINIWCQHLEQLESKINVITALESRGFLFAVPLSLRLKIPFVPIRKKGKLPGSVESVTFNLEYGTDTLEIQKNVLEDGQKVIIVDDLLATGGSLLAACELIKLTGAQVLECSVVIELTSLKGRDKIKSPFFSLLQF